MVMSVLRWIAGSTSNDPVPSGQVTQSILAHDSNDAFMEEVLC